MQYRFTRARGEEAEADGVRSGVCDCCAVAVVKKMLAIERQAKRRKHDAARLIKALSMILV